MFSGVADICEMGYVMMHTPDGMNSFWSRAQRQCQQYLAAQNIFVRMLSNSSEHTADRNVSSARETQQ